MGRSLHTRLDLVLPFFLKTKLVHNRQELRLSLNSDALKFTVGDNVSVRNFGPTCGSDVDQMIKSTQSTTVSVDVEPEHSVIHSEGAAPVNVDIDAAPSPNIKILYRQSVKTLMLYLKRQLNIMKQ